MTASNPSNDIGGLVVSRWRDFWFRDVPPHIYALLRILFGTIGFLTLVSISDISTFWDLNGFVSGDDMGLGVKAFLVAHHAGHAAGETLLFASLAVFAAFTVGLWSRVTVPLALTASLVDLSWNYLPHSGAYVTSQAILFCLIWADCGSVWSLDAWLDKRRGRASVVEPYPIAPLRLIRLQVCIVYLSTGFRKLYSEAWRDGSAIHYVLNTNVYQRFPHKVPVGLELVTTILTYTTLIWELGFAFAILYKPTRRIALVLGVLLHLGMQATLEIGPFAWVMLACYVAFLDPATVPGLPARLKHLLASLSPRRRGEAMPVS